MPPKQQKKQQQNPSKGSGTSSTSSRDTYGKSVLNRAENGNPIFAVTLALPSRTSATTSQSQEISSTASAMSGGAAICMMNSFSMEAEGIGLGDIILVYDKAKPFADSMFSAVTVWPSKYVLRGFIEVDENSVSNCGVKGGSDVQVELLKTPPATLKEITIEFVGDSPMRSLKDKNLKQSEIQDFLGASLSDKLICIGNTFSMKIYGKNYKIRAIALNGNKEGSEATNGRVFIVGGSTKIVIAAGSNSTEPELEDEVTQSEKHKSNVTFADVAGVSKIVELLKEAVILPLKSPEVFEKYGIKPPKGVLLYGASGTGKTLLAEAVAGSCGAAVFSITGAEALSRYVGESEAKLREVFNAAAKASPSIVIIDEIDALCPSRDESENEVDKRVVSTLLTLMDGLVADSNVRISVVATTSRPSVLDPALRRAGRLDKEIEIPVPSRESRKEILELYLNKSRHNLQPDEITYISNNTHGFVGADLAALVRNAGLHAFRRLKKDGLKDPSRFRDMVITFPDIKAAMADARPSAMRQVAVDVPNVKWSDIGGHEETKLKLKEAIELPVNHPEAFEEMGITPPCGILLYGPPGCSKTLMAQALATETGLNFIAIKGPQLLSKYVGDSERAVRNIFRKARQNAPCILFFDEIDGLVGRERDGDSEGGSSRVLSQFLTELDGVSPLKNVAVVAATNRPDLIDAALLRPGRIDRALYLGPPNSASRLEILKIHARKIPHKEEDLEALVPLTDGYTGADLAALCSTAALIALRENMDATITEWKHWDQALKQITPLKLSDMGSYTKFSSTAEINLI